MIFIRKVIFYLLLVLMFVSYIPMTVNGSDETGKKLIRIESYDTGKIHYISLDNEDGIDFINGKEYKVVGYTNVLKRDRYHRNSNTIYQVQPGDSLYLIAQKFNTTVKALKETNGLKDNLIYVGQELIISDSGLEDTGNDGEDSNKNVENYDEPGIVYFVKPGDSLFLISQRFNKTVTEIKDNNELSSNALYVGQLLYITLPATDNNKLIYYVQEGDNLSLIAKQFSTTVEKVKSTNNLTSNEIVTGQKLYVYLPDISNRDYNLILNYKVENNTNIDSIARKFDISSWEIRLFNNLLHGILHQGQSIQIPLSIPGGDLKSEEMIVSEEEKKLLARAVYSEARGEPFIGQVAVASVILNRVKSDLFPDTIEEVLFQPWQFEVVENGQIWLEPNQMAYLAAEAALKGWDPSQGAIYYYNPDLAKDDWIFYRDVVVEIGDHYFAVYKDIIHM